MGGSPSLHTSLIKMGFLHSGGYIPGAENQLSRHFLMPVRAAKAFFLNYFFKGLLESVGICNCVILMKQSVIFGLYGLRFL